MTYDATFGIVINFLSLIDRKIKSKQLFFAMSYFHLRYYKIQSHTRKCYLPQMTIDFEITLATLTLTHLIDSNKSVLSFNAMYYKA